LNAARLFFPEERPDEFNELLRTHWLAAEPRPTVIETIMTAQSDACEQASEWEPSR
jgi:hypothetical protein